jgi:hypothetical protein
VTTFNDAESEGWMPARQRAPIMSIFRDGETVTDFNIQLRVW